MLTKMRKMLKSQEGFTLIELITVLVILAVIIGIGLPRYMRMQDQSEYNADASAIKSFAKAAEVYAAQTNYVSATVSIDKLITAGLIDGAKYLNRISSTVGNTGGTSNRNTAKTTLGSTSIKAVTFAVSQTTGNCTDVDTAIEKIIGKKFF